MVKPKKRGFHPIGQNHVEKSDIGEGNRNNAVRVFGRQHFHIKRDEQKTKHPRQYRRKAVNRGLFEKISVNTQKRGFITQK